MLGGVSVVANVRVSRIESVTHPTTISPALTEMVPGPTPAYGNTRNYVRTFVVVMEEGTCVRACVRACVCGSGVMEETGAKAVVIDEDMHELGYCVVCESGV